MDVQVSTDSAVGDVYEFEVVGELGSLALTDFCRLKRSAPVQEWVVPKGSYGRVESVQTLVHAMTDVTIAGGACEGSADGGGGGGGGGGGSGSGSGGGGGGVISARQARHAQRLLDAIVASRGELLQVKYD